MLLQSNAEVDRLADKLDSDWRANWNCTLLLTALPVITVGTAN